MKCSNCGKELTKDIAGNNGLLRTYQCECLRLESAYEIEGPEWLLKLADHVCYRLDNERADNFKYKLKELIKSIKDQNDLRKIITINIQACTESKLKDLLRNEYRRIASCLDDGFIPSNKEEILEMSDLGQSLIHYAHMMGSDEPSTIMSDAWGVEYGSYGNKKSYEQSAIKYADIVLEVMEANCDKT